jgi:hypothetical protein
VYPGHRRFLSKQHTLRNKGKHFNGKPYHRPNPKERTGLDVFDMVKDLKVIFGKVLANNLFFMTLDTLQTYL